MKKMITVIYFGMLVSLVYSGSPKVFPIEGSVKSVKTNGVVVENVIIDEKYIAEKARQEYLKGPFPNKKMMENSKSKEKIEPITVFIFMDPKGIYDGQKVSIKAVECDPWLNPSSDETLRAFKKAGK